MTTPTIRWASTWRLRLQTLLSQPLSWPARSGWPRPGQPQATGCHAGWLFAWASQSSPNHANEDCAGAQRLRGFSYDGLAVAVADGVTMAAAGAVASKSLVRFWLARRPPAGAAARTAWLSAADDHVAQALRAHTPDPGAATGVAAWLSADGSAWATRVGDCRVLRAHYRGQEWAVVSEFDDQTLGNLHPEIFLNSDNPQADQPACFVGCQRLGTPEWKPLELQIGELLILASDGLHASLGPGDWEHELGKHLPQGAARSGQDIPITSRFEKLCHDLIQRALHQGSDDDITVLVVTRNQGGIQ